jgi:DNA repair protein RadC
VDTERRELSSEFAEQDASMRIADWPEDERPRERLLKHGAAALSEAELLAIFLRTGVAGRSAVELGRELIARFGSLQRLFTATLDEVATIRGLGPAKYAQLKAVIEMARRALVEDIGERDGLSSPRAVRDYLQLTLGGRAHEVFMALFLDAQNRLLASEELFRGTLTQTSVYPREVVKTALRHNAAGVIFAHNHPRGRRAEPRGRTADADAEAGAVAGRDQDARSFHRGRNAHRFLCRARPALTTSQAETAAPRCARSLTCDIGYNLCSDGELGASRTWPPLWFSPRFTSKQVRRQPLQKKAKAKGTKMADEVRNAMDACLAGISAKELELLDAATPEAKQHLDAMAFELDRLNARVNATLSEVNKRRAKSPIASDRRRAA